MACACFQSCAVTGCRLPDGTQGLDLLFNNICLPKVWPPRIRHSHESGGQPGPIPYISTPPPVITIDVGRQVRTVDPHEDSHPTRESRFCCAYIGDPEPYRAPIWGPRRHRDHGTAPRHLLRRTDEYSTTKQEKL